MDPNRISYCRLSTRAEVSSATGRAAFFSKETAPKIPVSLNVLQRTATENPEDVSSLDQIVNY